MYQTKIFRGSFSKNLATNEYYPTADELFNEWIIEHPNIKIIEFEYRHDTRGGCHSICILYKEEKINDI